MVHYTVTYLCRGCRSGRLMLWLFGHRCRGTTRTVTGRLAHCCCEHCAQSRDDRVVPLSDRVRRYL